MVDVGVLIILGAIFVNYCTKPWLNFQIFMDYLLGFHMGLDFGSYC